MNKIEQQKTQICTNPVKHQWRKTMKNTLPTMMLSAAIATASFSLPTHAAVIDQVKDKVNAIKNDTNTLKSKATDNQNRLGELSMTMNAAVMETIDIRTALDPVFGIREKFEELGIDPAELLDDVPMEDFKKMIDDMKERKAERQAMLTESVEPFRADFIGLIQSLNSIVREDDAAIQVTPLQTLIESAPAPVLAMLRVIVSPIFDQLQIRVAGAAQSLETLRSLGVLDAMELATPGGIDPLSLGSSREERLCTIAGKATPVEFAVWQFGWQADEIKALIAETKEKVEGAAKNTNYELQIHGWLKFLSFNPFDGLTGSLEGIELQVDKQQMRIEHVVELAARAREWGSCGEIVSYAL